MTRILSEAVVDAMKSGQEVSPEAYLETHFALLLYGLQGAGRTA